MSNDTRLDRAEKWCWANSQLVNQAVIQIKQLEAFAAAEVALALNNLIQLREIEMNDNNCAMCDAAIPSPHHDEKCRQKSVDDIIKIANGHINQCHKLRSMLKLAHEKNVMWQGKFNLVKHENNQLRKKQETK